MSIVQEKRQIKEIKEIDIPIKQVIRRLGYPSEKEINGASHRILVEEIQKAPELLKPMGIYRVLQVETRNQEEINFIGSSFKIQSRQVSKMLMHADPVILFMVTIGPHIEEKVKELFDEDEMARGVILDAIGSETTDAVADRMHHVIIKEMAQSEGYTTTPRFSPGYGDWPVTVQKDFLKACGGDRIGISVNDSFLMTPRNSVSAVLGWKKMS